MKRRVKNADPQKLIEEYSNRQRNTVWPDTLINSRRVDGLLWRGDPKAPLVQRIGVALFGLVFLGFGLVLAGLARQREGTDFWACCTFSCALLAIGVRLLYNAVRRK